MMTLLALNAGTAGALAFECEKYVKLERLPNGFVELSSAELPYSANYPLLEYFQLSDGSCTCNNGPTLNRAKGNLAPEHIVWSCRSADADEAAYVLEQGKE